MVATLLRILLLTLMWILLQGTLSVGHVLLGVVFGWGILRMSGPLFNPRERRLRRGARPLRRLWWNLLLLLVFLREVVRSALQVAWFVIQPTLDIRPAIIEYPLDVKTDREITALANMISLTPGTLSLDVSPDRSCLYVHSIFVEDEDASVVQAEIKSTLEKHISRALGPSPDEDPEEASGP